MSPKQKRVGIYLRVSQADQTTDNQRIDLERVAEQRGWDVVEVYLDHGISGKRDWRPALDRLRKDALHGKLDVVAAWSIDRLGRSLPHVVNLLAELTEQKVAVHQQQVDSTTIRRQGDAGHVRGCSLSLSGTPPQTASRPASSAPAAKASVWGVRAPLPRQPGERFARSTARAWASSRSPVNWAAA